VFAVDETGYSISDSRHPRFDVRSEESARSLACAYKAYARKKCFYNFLEEDVAQEMYLHLLLLGPTRTKFLFLNAMRTISGRPELPKNQGTLVSLTNNAENLHQTEVEDTTVSVLYLAELEEEKEILNSAIGHVLSGIKFCPLASKKTDDKKIAVLTKWITDNRSVILNRTLFKHIMEYSKSVGKEKLRIRHYKTFYERSLVKYAGPTMELVEDRTASIKAFVYRCKSSARYVLDIDFGRAIDTLVCETELNAYLHETLTRAKASKQ